MIANAPGGEPLADLRHRLDDIDQRLLDALAARLRAAAEVGALKARLGVDAWDLAREAAIVRRAAASARAAGVPEEAVRHVFWTILGHCRETVAAAGPSGAPSTASGAGA